jgi:hypothetical protein
MHTYHPGKHAPKAPHVQRVVVILQINKKFRSLEIPELNEKMLLSDIKN